MDHYILLLSKLSNHMHFITNGFKRFSKPTSTDPKQRVPLNCRQIIAIFIYYTTVLYSARIYPPCPQGTQGTHVYIYSEREVIERLINFFSGTR